LLLHGYGSWRASSNWRRAVVGQIACKHYPVKRPQGRAKCFCWRGARLAGTPNSAGRQTIWHSQFVQGAVRAADQVLPPISPALPCLARSSAAGGSAGFKSSQVSHAKPPRFAGNDKPWPAAAARVMQQHAGQAL